MVEPHCCRISSSSRALRVHRRQRFYYGRIEGRLAVDIHWVGLREKLQETQVLRSEIVSFVLSNSGVRGVYASRKAECKRIQRSIRHASLFGRNPALCKTCILWAKEGGGPEKNRTCRPYKLTCRCANFKFSLSQWIAVRTIYYDLYMIVDLKVHSEIVCYKGRQGSNMRPREVFVFFLLSSKDLGLATYFDMRARKR